MKVLIATGLYPPEVGGPATYTVLLEKHLPSWGIFPKVVPYCFVRKYPKYIRHILYIGMLVWYARGVEALYALDTVSVGLPVLIASILTQKPYFLRVPGDYAWEQGQQRFGVTETLDEYRVKKTSYKLPVLLLAYIQRIVASHAHHIIVPSEYLKDVVLGWGVDAAHITRIYSSPREILIPESKEKLRTQFGYTDFVIVTACRLVPWKGVHALIDVVHSLRTSGLPVVLTILGDGVCRKELEEKIDALSLRSSVTLMGDVDRQEVGRRTKAADVFVLNTSYEGMSHQLIEVMRLGTPIITTSVGGNGELIEQRKTGLLVPYNDVEAFKQSIREVCEDTTLGKALAECAQKHIVQFDEEKIIKEFVTLMSNNNV